MGFIDDVHEIFAEALQEVAPYGNLPYVPPRPDGDLIQVQNLAASRRMERRNWALDLPPDSGKN